MSHINLWTPHESGWIPHEKILFLLEASFFAWQEFLYLVKDWLFCKLVYKIKFNIWLVFFTWNCTAEFIFEAFSMFQKANCIVKKKYDFSYQKANQKGRKFWNLPLKMYKTTFYNVFLVRLKGNCFLENFSKENIFF